MVEVTEAPITQADMVAAEMQAQKHYQTAHDYEMGLRQSYATHREAAAKTERDRLRECLKKINVAVSHGKMGDWSIALDEIRKYVADALEKQP